MYRISGGTPTVAAAICRHPACRAGIVVHSYLYRPTVPAPRRGWMALGQRRYIVPYIGWYHSPAQVVYATWGIQPVWLNGITPTGYMCQGPFYELILGETTMAKPICQPLIFDGLQSKNKNPTLIFKVGNIQIHIFSTIFKTKRTYFKNQGPAITFRHPTKL